MSTSTLEYVETRTTDHQHPLPRHHHREGNRSMTDINLDELKALARKATPGPWQALTTGVRYGDHWYITDDGETVAYATKNDGDPRDKCRENAEYIAAANPSTIIALIADLRRAQECIDATKNMLGDEKRNPAMRLLGITQAVIAYDEGKTDGV